MIKELYVTKMKEVAVNINRNRIDEIRKKNITKSGCRVYKDGYIGIAGTLGDATEETWKKAEENLKDKIPYNYEPCKNKKRKEDFSTSNIEINDFINRVEELLEILKNEYNDFSFLGKIKLIESEDILKNDAGLDYISLDKYFEVDLNAQYKNSKDIVDVGMGMILRDFDKDLAINEIKIQLDGFTKPVELPKKDKMPIIVDFPSITDNLTINFNGESLMRGTSIFSSKLGEKTFSEKFTLYMDRSKDNPYMPFFDAEGNTLENDKAILIDKGIIKVGLTNKKVADEYKIENTAGALADYDEVPNLNAESYLRDPRFNLKSGDKTLAEILGDREAIYVVAMAGGDYTNEGNFASPVQISYLIKNGKVIGKLPEFSVSGSVFNMFGKDCLGISSDKAYMGNNALVIDMNILHN